MAARDRRITGSFKILVAANGVSVFGDYLNMIAFSLFAFAVTRSALATALLLALRLGAGLASASTAGRLATTRDRRTLLVSSDLAQAAVMVLLGVSVGSRFFSTLALCLAALITGAGVTISSVTLRASIPVLVGDESRSGANSLMTAIRSAAMALGFATGGVIVAAGGYREAFIANAASFLVSATVVRWLPLPFRERRSEDERASVAEQPASARHARIAWRPRLPRPPALGGLAPLTVALVCTRTADAVGSGSHNVGLPVYFTDWHPHKAAVYFGGFWTAWALGALAISALAPRLYAATRREPGIRAFTCGTCLMSVSFVLAFVHWPLAILAIVAICAGAADGFTEISYTTALQSAPDDERGHLFALSAFGETGGLGTGMLVAGVLITVAGTLANAAILHGIAIVLALRFLARYGWRHSLAKDGDPLTKADVTEVG